MSEGNSFIFYRSFYEALQELKPADRAAVYDATCELALNGEVKTKLSGIPKAIFTLIRPQIEANQKRQAAGKKGGRPRKKKEPTVIEDDEEAKTNGFRKGINKKTIGFEKQNQRLENSTSENAQKQNLIGNWELGIKNWELGIGNDKENTPLRECKETTPTGPFQNVILDPEQLQDLKERFPEDYTARIDRLSTYMQSSGKVYQDHYATILLWAEEDKQKADAGLPDWYADLGETGPTDDLQAEIQRLREGKSNESS